MTDNDKTIANTSNTSSTTGFTSGLALILAVSAFSVSVYLFYLYYQHRDLYTSNVVDQLSALYEQGRALEDENKNLAKDIQALKDSQSTLLTALQTVQGKLGRNRDYWLITETERLLVIANHRLQLARDVDSAIAALSSADTQLKQLADPRLLPVRKNISEELALLKSLERIDVPGIALRLTTLTNNLDRLAVTAEPPRPAKTQASAETGNSDEKTSGLQQLWQDILGLFRLRTNVEHYQPLLAPEQSYFLRQNVKLQLYSAQQALLAGDSKTYQNNILLAQQWLRDYFNQDNKQVAAALDELKQLATLEIALSLPDISQSLKALRQLSAKNPHT
ncbi:MAG: hypothetical protein BMS9Abin36_0338 [Gammaproteobacteria bacterium]|nr:MAG: hypothetical protein BMS9Abin36_0338 [Gammaproteobacteria bacterium]